VQRIKSIMALSIFSNHDYLLSSISSMLNIRKLDILYVQLFRNNVAVLDSMLENPQILNSWRSGKIIFYSFLVENSNIITNWNNLSLVAQSQNHDPGQEIFFSWASTHDLWKPDHFERAHKIFQKIPDCTLALPGHSMEALTLVLSDSKVINPKLKYSLYPFTSFFSKFKKIRIDRFSMYVDARGSIPAGELIYGIHRGIPFLKSVVLSDRLFCDLLVMKSPNLIATDDGTPTYIRTEKKNLKYSTSARALYELKDLANFYDIYFHWTFKHFFLLLFEFRTLNQIRFTNLAAFIIYVYSRNLKIKYYRK